MADYNGRLLDSRGHPYPSKSTLPPQFREESQPGDQTPEQRAQEIAKCKKNGGTIDMPRRPGNPVFCFPKH